MVEILDPTDERVPIPRDITPRPEAITGTVGLLDISKARGDVFLDRMEQLFHQRLPGVRVLRFAKPTMAKPAPVEVQRAMLKDCDFVVEALAD